MKWWIGQVTDPVKGDWVDSLEKTQAEKGTTDDNDIYALRCRVRIVGYHGCEDDLPDKDLPMAHVLLPPNTSTVGGCGETLQYQGGEVVVGFFADGDDAQQPIIFGTLFKQTFVADELTVSKFNAKKQTCFTPYTPPKVVETSGKDKQYQKSAWPRAFSPGELYKTISQEQKEKATNITIDAHSPCQDNEISKISNAIKDFTAKIETLQSLNQANTYVDPIYGGIVDIQDEVRIATTRIHNSTSKLLRRARTWTIQETLDKLNLTLGDKVDKFNQVPTSQATKGLNDIIFCNLEKIQDELLGYLSKSLENMIGSVLDVPICGVENFMSDMFGQINNILDTRLGSMFSQLNNIQGGGIGLPSSTFSKAIKFANILTNVLDCDRLNCPPTTVFSSKNGVSASIEDTFDSIISKTGLDRLKNLAEGISDIGDAIPALPSRPNCSTNVLKCGPPRVDFIGSAGEGATGSAIVNALGNIIGVAINGQGFGYKEPPALSFFDSCDKGYGAGGYAVLGEVTDPNGNRSLGVTNVVITSPGQEYLPNTTETDLDGNVKEITPDPNESYDGEISYVTSLDDVVVQNTGFGYDDNDTATVGGGSVSGVGGVGGVGSDTSIRPGQAEVELNIQDGRIIGVNVKNGGFGFTGLPDLTINTDTGVGAKLLPVLKFTKVDTAKQLADTNVPFNRDLPQNVVVTVIDCIHK